MEKNNREKGAVYEDKAALFLEKKGYQILEKNFYTRQGEIDIVAKDENCLVFAEVKYRKKDGLSSALFAVTKQKQKRLIAAAKIYLYVKKYRMDIPCRFDVIAFDGEEITHIVNAIEAG